MVRERGVADPRAVAGASIDAAAPCRTAGVGRILVSLAEIDVAVTAIRARLDALEDALPRQAA